MKACRRRKDSRARQAPRIGRHEHRVAWRGRVVDEADPSRVQSNSAAPCRYGDDAPPMIGTDQIPMSGFSASLDRRTQ